TSWSINGPDVAPLTDGHSYEATAQATDTGSTTTGSPVGFGVDKTSPAVTNIHVVNTAANGLDLVQSGGTYYVVATVSDATSGVASVTANLNTLTSGATSVALSACSSCSIRGTTYNYQSANFTAGSIGAGT